jgi:hypothetical protein
MLLPTMHIELIIAIKSLSTEAAQRVSLETTLILSSRVVVSISHMLLQFLVRKQVVLMGEDFLMSCAEIAHLLVVDTPYMAMQFWPCPTCNIARRLWAIVVQQDK